MSNYVFVNVGEKWLQVKNTNRDRYIGGGFAISFGSGRDHMEKEVRSLVTSKIMQGEVLEHHRRVVQRGYRG